MKRLQSKSVELCREGLFRAASGIEVLAGCGRVFSPEAALPQEAFHSKEKVNQVDVFVSHSWHAGRWSKYLAVCLFLNLGLALKATAMATLLCLIMACLIFPSLSVAMTFFVMMDVPALTFVLVLLFGQSLTCGRWCPSLWVDKLCVDQVDHDNKQRGIAGLPTMVACTSELLILWDETYFERLWCNLELSTFVKCRGVQRLRFQPLWLAPWLLTMMFFTWLEMQLQAAALIYEPNLGNEGNKHQEVKLGTLMFGWEHLLTFVSLTQAFTVFYFPAALASVGTFQHKLDGHKMMLEHLESYDIRSAKCAVESDRAVIEGHVADLFDGLEDSVISVPLGSDRQQTEEVPAELPEASLTREARLAVRSITGYTHEDCLEVFNDYVRGPLREAIVEQLGYQADLSWTICFMSFLPNMLYSIAFGWMYRYSHEDLGYASFDEFLVVTFVQQLVFGLVCMPLTNPCLLKLMGFLTALVGPGLLRGFLAFMLALLSYGAVLTAFGVVAGSLESWAFTKQPIFMVIFGVGLALLLLLNYVVFLGKLWLPTSSCRCLHRAPPEYKQVF